MPAGTSRHLELSSYSGTMSLESKFQRTLYSSPGQYPKVRCFMSSKGFARYGIRSEHTWYKRAKVQCTSARALSIIAFMSVMCDGGLDRSCDINLGDLNRVQTEVRRRVGDGIQTLAMQVKI